MLCGHVWRDTFSAVQTCPCNDRSIGLFVPYYQPYFALCRAVFTDSRVKDMAHEIPWL